MADQTSKSRRWELGLRPHREELSFISRRTNNPEDRNHENKKEKRKKERKMMENQHKADDNDVAEAEEKDRNHEIKKEKRKMQKQRKKERKMMENQHKADDNDVAEAEEKDRNHENEKEKMKMMENQHKANDNDVAEAEEYNDLLVCEILSRLPAKSLMRCKCVCKAWKSIIEHDSHFINLHHTRSQAHPGFLIAAFLPYCEGPEVKNGETFGTSFFSADLHCDNNGGIEASIDTVTRGLKSEHIPKYCLGPVRGLVCLIDQLYAVQICNVSTGQATPWIKSELATVMLGKHSFWPGYQFGYDPKTGKHKVVYVWTGVRFKEDRFCEVLTVGDTRWRRVIDDVVPDCNIRGNHRSAYINGSVYWVTASSESIKILAEYLKSQSLLAFDIGSEKFRMIPIPSFAQGPENCLGIIEMDGCITMIRVESIHHPTSPELKLWKFRDDQEEWTEEDIIIPSYLSNYMADVFLHPIPGKDQQMILEINCRMLRNVNTARFCCYDLRKKTFSKFEIQGISSALRDCCTVCAIYVESIFPVC